MMLKKLLAKANLVNKTEIKYLFIEITNRCNFSCTFCPDSKMKRKRGFMDKKTVHKIIKEAAKKKLNPEPLQFHLMGEPLLSKDIFEYIDYAHSLGHRIRLLSNGSLLNESMARKIFVSGIGELVLGIQAWGEESFKTNRNGKIGYAEYIKNIKRAIELKFEEGAVTKLYIHYLNTKQFNRDRAEKGYKPVFSPELVDNDAKALAIVEEWSNFGKSVSEKYSLNFEPKNLECLAGDYKLYPLDCLFGDHAEILPGVILGFKAISPFSDWLMKDVRYVEKFKGTCPSVWEQFAVLADGTCTPCCVDYEGLMGVGNAGKNDLTKLWNSPAAKKYRKKMEKGIYPHNLCRICKAFVVNDDYFKKLGNSSLPFELIDGFYNLEHSGEKNFRWLGKASRIRIEGEFAALKMELKNSIPMSEKLKVILTQGANKKTFRLKGRNWHKITFPLEETNEFGDTIEIESASFFIPSELDKKNSDSRELALMVGSIEPENKKQ